MFDVEFACDVDKLYTKSYNHHYYHGFLRFIFPKKNNFNNLLFAEYMYVIVKCYNLCVINGLCYMCNPLILFYIGCRIEIMMTKKNINPNDHQKYREEYFYFRYKIEKSCGLDNINIYKYI
jgi:hypothetical protein